MAYGFSPCLIDSSITAEQAYEQTLGLVPDGYHAVACCGTLNCVRHVTIKRHSPGRFDNPELAPVIMGVPTRDRVFPDEQRLKLARSMAERGHNKFKSEAKTWDEYCLDYVTSPQTTAEESRIFCYRHRLARGLTCICGQKHKQQQRSDESECRLYNPPGVTIDEYIAANPSTDCGRAIVGLPAVPHDETEVQNAAAEAVAEEKAYLDASREITAAFRKIRVILDGEFLGSWRN